MPGLSTDKGVPWYTDDIKEIPDKAREFVQSYTGLPADSVVPHIVKIREKAWQIHPYPCIGGFRFLDPGLSSSPFYGEVVERLKEGEMFLDLGTCFGQDIRKLISDGVPSQNLSGVDIDGEFMNIGYDLFADHDKNKATFIVANLLEATPSNSDLELVAGRIDIAWAGAFFHVFCLEDQIKVATMIVKDLMRPKASVVILGRQAGNMNPRHLPDWTEKNGKDMFVHDGKTWRKLWKDVGNATGTEWELYVNLDPPAAAFAKDPDNRLLTFSARRI